MRKVFILPLALALAFAACQSGSNNEKGQDSSAVSAMDSGHDMSMDTSSVPPLPAVPAGAKVFFKNLKDGQTVTSPLTIQFGHSGIALEPKGTVKDSVGHHHLLIDTDFYPAGQVIPDDSTHIHYGNAQTEGTVKLTPGKHKLTLQYGDGIHRSYGEPLSKTITVTVK